LCKQVAGQLSDLASISKLNNKLINNDSPGTDWHAPFLLDIVNCQVDSLHGRLVIRENSFGFGVFADAAIQTLDGVGSVNDPPDLHWIVKVGS